MTVWEPGTQYNLGDVVEYEGARYKIIQAHRSQSDWAPPIVPALWGRIPGSECQSQEPCNPPDKGSHCGQGVQRPNDSYQQPNQSVEAPHEEQKKHRFNLDDNKDELIAGGLVAGVAALGIGGYAYHQHQKHKNDAEEPPRDDEERTGGFLHDNKNKLIAGGLAAGAAAVGGYAYNQHQKHKNGDGEEEQQAPSQVLPPDARERAEGFLHDNKNKLIVGGLAAGAAAIGGYAYHQHQKHQNDDGEEEKQPPSQGLPPDSRERAEGFLHDNKNKLIAGGLAAGAAAVGGYAYHQHQKHQNDDGEEEKQTLSQRPPQDAQERTEGFLGDNKEKLLAGGALGAAALGIGGYAYHEHEKHKKERAEEETRTEGYNGRRSGGPPTWVLVDGRDNIPDSAIVAGRDKDNHPIYIARAHHENSLQIGKASPLFREGAAIGYAGRVVELRKFEVLVGDDRAIRWVSFSYQLNLRELQARPVEGGKEANGAPLYIARVRYSGGVHTAKIGEHLPAAQVAFSGTEVAVDDYEVLCYN